jgi:hypothetical protein
VQSNNSILEVSCSDSDFTSNVFNGILNLNSYNLDDFIGIPDILLAFTNTTSLSGTCDNNDLGDKCSAYSNAYWTGSVSVAYTYDEHPIQSVPEPSTFLLLGAGLLGLSFVGKRRKQLVLI